MDDLTLIVTLIIGVTGYVSYLGFEKKTFFYFSAIFFEIVIFFKNVRSFVRTFTLNKIYRHTIPYFLSQEWSIPFPEMYSNRNLNVWNIFKY